MRFFQTLSIKYKLMWISIGTSGFALALAGVALGVSQMLMSKHDILDRLSTQASIISANSTAALVFNNQPSARQTLSALSAETPIVAAGIYSKDDSLFASYSYSDAKADNGLVPVRLPEHSHRFESGHLQVVRPIVLDGERIGTVYLRADLRELYSQLRIQCIIIALVLLISLMAALLSSSKLQSMISKPILCLAETAKAISRDKNYGLRVEKHSQDELGVLMEAFNEMLTQIQDRDEQLKRHKAHLEELVARRTGELHKLNEQLKHQAHHLEELVAIRTGELHNLNEQLKYQAYHDNLTGLPNRALFNDRLSQDILHSERSGQLLAVLFLDLDRFKYINDTLGHPVGDELLRMVAARLRHLVRRDDTVARQGGDEFTILLRSIGSKSDAGEIAQKIISAMEQPFDCPSNQLHVTASIGVAVYPDDGQDAETLMRNADTAMYSAKGQGRNNYSFYAAGMHANSLQQLELENSLRHALLREDFEVHYQPQCDIQSGRIVAVEALVRWRHRDMGLVPPAVFIPILEETGLIIPVGKWILKNVCVQAKAWKDAGLPPVWVTVNFSSRQFHQKELGRTVEQIIEETGFTPDCLTLEITESILMDNAEETIATLKVLSAMGVHLAIDDFGTGYSSLSYLKRFPIDAVKIDKSFVRDITTDPDDAVIVEAIIAMAHTLKLKVVAEGVETEEQLALLRGYRCDAVQGYLFSEPLPNEELIPKLSVQ